MGRQHKDLTYKTFGLWQVIGLDTERTQGYIYYYKCLCTGCRKTYSVRCHNLTQKKSTRCLTCANKGRNSVRSSKIKLNDAPWVYLYKDLRKGAKRRNLEFSLSLESVKLLSLGNCTYCGTFPKRHINPLKHHRLSQYRIAYGDIVVNGIDRVDSSKGYIPENVVSCCETCNKAKLTMSTTDFRTWVARVYHHLFKQS